MQRIIVAPHVFVPMEIRYDSPIDGRHITTKQARQNDLARSGSRPWEGLDQERKEAARQEQYAEQKQDAKLEQSVSEAFYQMPETKRDILIKGAAS